jgi:hypothetical protein
VLFRIIFGWSDYTTSSFFATLFLFAVNYFCYSSIISSIELGVDNYSTAQDILFLNWAVMILTPFTDWAFYIFLVVSQREEREKTIFYILFVHVVHI